MRSKKLQKATASIWAWVIFLALLMAVIRSTITA